MTPKRYFGGTSVQGGKVHLLRATTFRQLVEAYIHVPVPIRMTRHEFLAHPDRDQLKDGPYICPASFPFEEGDRNNQNADAVNLVIVDLDEGDFVKDFFESPGTIREALGDLAFVCWSTAKHTPEAPRLKIAVDVKTCDKTHHLRLARWVIRLLGLPFDFKGARETRTLSLPQYRPVVFMGEQFSAVIASNLDGEPLDESEVPELETDSPDRQYAYTGDSDEMELMFLPSFGIAVEDIREPLFAIDADCLYEMWTKVACALRHNFPGEDDAREAFELFLEWSMTGSKFKSEQDCYNKWRSFKPYASGRAPITIRSLYKFAMDAGWSNTAIAAKVTQHVSEWIANTEDASLLMSQGPRRIADMPFKNEIVEEALCKILCDKLKLHSMMVSISTIKKEVKAARNHDRTETVREENPSWVLPFCFIGPQNLFRNTVTGDTYAPDAFNNTFARFLVAPKDDTPDAGDSSRPVVLPSNKALNEVQIKIVSAELYDPREKSGKNPYFEINGRWYVNTFLDSTVPIPDPTHSKRAGELFKTLLRVNFENELYERIFLDWFAFIVQNPGVLLRWSIFMQGAQGCGKGTFGDCLASAIGQANFKTISASAMSSDFNDWRSGAQVVFVDEIKAPGKNRFEVLNKLKDAITNTVIPVNQKFKDVVNIPNVSNYILTTNNIDALALEDSDRRFFVLLSKIQFRDQVLALNAMGILAEIHSIIENHPGAFRQFFLDHEIHSSFPVNGPAPETTFRQEMIDGAKNPMLTAIERQIADADQPLIGDDVIHIARLEDLVGFYARNNNSVAHYLRQLGYERHAAGELFTIGGVKTEIYVHSRNYCDLLGDPEELLAVRCEKDEL